MDTNNKYDVVVIGAGITGLTTTLKLLEAGKRVALVERENRLGGQIKTYTEGEYVFESGPNTGVLSNTEIYNLFANLEHCNPEIACKDAKRRLILKKGKLHALPAGLIAGIKTPLFTWKDKCNILLEPFRAKSNNPNESIGALTRRRLGKSFLNYAVNPFISGIYAGNPDNLVTRHALPKLYYLEQNYGSFIMGAVKKAREPKTETEKAITKDVFSVYGGLERWIESLQNTITKHYANHVSIRLNAQQLTVKPCNNQFLVNYTTPQHTTETIQAPLVIPTIAGYEYQSLFPFLQQELLQPITSLEYAGVVQVSVGISSLNNKDLQAFGALIPTKEKRDTLGILFLSSCFKKRSPKGGAMLSFFIGGAQRKDLLLLSDAQIEAIVYNELDFVLGIKAKSAVTLLRIHRHLRAIPQYKADTDRRLNAIQQIEQTYPGIIIGGNILGGIGMADRVRQAYLLAQRAKDYQV